MSLPKDWTARMLGWYCYLSRRGNVIAIAPIPSEKEPLQPLPSSFIDHIKSHGHKVIRHGVHIAKKQQTFLSKHQGVMTGRFVSKHTNHQEVVR